MIQKISNTISSFYKSIGPFGTMLIALIVIIFLGMMMMKNIVTSIMQQNETYTRQVIEQYETTKRKTHNEKYYNNLKRLPELQTMLYNFCNQRFVPHLCVLELHNGESSLTQMPFCKFSATYEAFNSSVRDLNEDSFFTNPFQNQIISSWPAILEHLMKSTLTDLSKQTDIVSVYVPKKHRIHFAEKHNVDTLTTLPNQEDIGYNSSWNREKLYEIVPKNCTIAQLLRANASFNDFQLSFIDNEDQRLEILLEKMNCKMLFIGTVRSRDGVSSALVICGVPALLCAHHDDVVDETFEPSSVNALTNLCNWCMLGIHHVTTNYRYVSLLLGE